MDKGKSAQPITLKNSENELVTDPNQIVQLLNDHYISVADTEIERNPIFKTVTTSTYSLSNEKTTLDSFAAHEITTFEVHRGPVVTMELQQMK